MILLQSFCRSAVGFGSGFFRSRRMQWYMLCVFPAAVAAAAASTRLVFWAALSRLRSCLKGSALSASCLWSCAFLILMRLMASSAEFSRRSECMRCRWSTSIQVSSAIQCFSRAPLDNLKCCLMIVRSLWEMKSTRSSMWEAQ